MIGSLFPPVKATGRPPVDRRRVVAATMWRYHTGAPWRDLSNENDLEEMSFTLDGEQVLLEVVLRTWHTQYSVATSTSDEPSQQLTFGIPGAGPNAPRALLIVSFADTGQFNWID